MGAYLSEPITKKISSDESGKNVAFGASSMQGWRVSQEDAHNCCIEFDENTSLFAVYDGHGGHEVATYCAKELPDFIKNTDAYKNGNIKEALIDAFLGFDAALAKPDIINVLKEIAGTTDNERDKGDLCVSGDDEESVSDLRMEAAMPLEQVMARYQTDFDDAWTRTRDEEEEACAKQSSGSGLYSRCRRGREKPTTRWPMGPSCSSSSSSWNADEQDVSSSSQACSSSAIVPADNIEKKSSSPNGEPSLDSTTSNGLIDPDSSDDTGVANTSQKNENTIVNDVNGEQRTKTIVGNAVDSSKNLGEKVSSSSSESLENGNNGKQSDKVIECQSTITPQPTVEPHQSLLQKGNETRRRKIRLVTVKQRELDADEDDDDDDDDDENDETFDGSPIGCDDDTEDMDDDDDDDDGEDGEDDDDDDEDSSEGEEDDENKEGDDDGEFTMEMTEEPGSDSGCTAVVAILHDRDLYVANAGDSRCVLCRDGQALELSLDHKPEDQPEMERIVKAGGKVTADGRVNGGLNLSRALGDHAYKQNTTLPLHEQMISALPDVRHIKIDHNRDDFMILACDGIWNFMSSQEVVAFVRPRLVDVEKPNISKICEELFDHCLAPNTLGDGTGCDNMTAVIVKFNRVDSTSDLPTTNSTIVQSSLSKKRPISPSNETIEIPEKNENSNEEGCNSTTMRNNDFQSDDCKRPKTDIH